MKKETQRQQYLPSGGWENTARFVNAISLELPLPCGVRY